MNVIKCKPFGPGVQVFVNADNISHFRGYEANGYHGSKIVMRDGNEVLTGEWPEDLSRMVAVPPTNATTYESTRLEPHVLNG